MLAKSLSLLWISATLINAAQICKPVDAAQKITAIDIVLVLDDSISMKDEKDTIASGMKKLTTEMNTGGIDARVAVIRYGGNPVIQLPFVNDAATIFEAVNSLSSNATGYEAAFESVRRSLPPTSGRDMGGTEFCSKVFTKLAVPCTLDWRQHALKVIIQATDEDSDLPQSVKERTSGQVATGKYAEADAGYPLTEAFKVEIDNTANLLIEHKAVYLALISQEIESADNDVNTVKISIEQFGNFKLAAQDGSFGNFDAAKTLQALESNGLGRSLQAQMLKKNGTARLFDINAFTLGGQSGAILTQFQAEIKRALDATNQVCKDEPCAVDTFFQNGTCVACPANTASEKDSMAISSCRSKPGFFGKAGSIATTCPIDSYCVQGAEVAVPCGDGSYSDGKTGLKAASECVCKVNFFAANGACSACPANSKTLQANSPSKESCVCLAGFYGAKGGDCTRCPERKTTKDAGALTIDQCVCESDDLKGPECTAALKCVNDGKPNDANTACVCAPGFDGTLCDVVLPKCLNGAPLDTATKKCVCTAEFTGDTCETKVLACANGGKAKADNSACECATGFFGSTCQTAVIVCQNGGTANPDNSACTCVQGFSGTTCAVPPVTTTSIAPTATPTPVAVTCLNGGILNADGKLCTCISGYTGSVCETSPAKVCLNGGTYNAVSQTCICTSTFSGSSCEVAAFSSGAIRTGNVGAVNGSATTTTLDVASSSTSTLFANYLFVNIIITLLSLGLLLSN
jgi:hypothetical protein